MERKKAPTCPICGAKGKLVNSALIYNGRNFGYAYKCPRCEDVYVTCIPGTKKPAGEMCDATTRALRQQAYRSFTDFATNARNGFRNKAEARGWLANKLDIAYAGTSIAEMDAETCQKVLELMKMEEAG